MDEYLYQQNQNPAGNYQMPAQVTQDLTDNAFQIVKVLTEHNDFLTVFKRELRGEQLFEDDKGTKMWIQVDKPMFIKLDKNDAPIMIKDSISKKNVYVCNDEAVNEVCNILKMCGLNQIAPLTNITAEEIREDLLEMECKIAMLLAVNRKKWGLYKSGYPIAVGKLKVLIKDARYRAKDGTVLRALRTMTTRMEQSSEIKQPQKQGILN